MKKANPERKVTCSKCIFCGKNPPSCAAHRDHPISIISAPYGAPSAANPSDSLFLKVCLQGVISLPAFYMDWLVCPLTGAFWKIAVCGNWHFIRTKVPCQMNKP